MTADFAERVRPALESQLAEGETVQGVVAATYQKTFSGSLYAIAVTDRRVVLQPLDRHLQAKGPATSITPEALASADVDGAGGGWWTAPAAVLDMAAIAITFRTTDGEGLKLSMMKGGTGMMGALGGGESQRDGVLALAAWLQRTLGSH
jgi:hypothetical protein